jgi:hypothetical protein
MSIFTRGHAGPQGLTDNLDLFFARDQSVTAALVEYDLLSSAPACRHCDDSDPELRYCSNNRGVGFQCANCLHMCGKGWVPHRDLVGLQLKDLPRWVLR